MLKQTFWLSVINLAVITFSPTAIALRVEEVPSPRQTGGWVTDRANILSPETEAELNRLITELEAQNGSEIMVVTVPETSPYSSPKEFTTTWFNYWTIGKKGQDNGVLFMYSTGDDRIEIETGYGVENILPDAQVGNLIRQEIRPRFKKGDFEGGTLVGTKELIAVLKTYQPHPSPHSETVISLPRQPTRLIDQQYMRVFIGGGILLSLIACGGILVLYRRPTLIKPQGHCRIKRLDDHDKVIYYLVYLGLFSTTFTVALIVSNGLVLALIPGGMNCILFSRWLNRSKMKRSAVFNNSSEAAVACCGLVFLSLFLLVAIPLIVIVIELGAPGLSAALIIGGIVYLPLSLIPKKIFDKDRKRRSIRPLHCAKCQQPMQQIDAIADSPYLREPEKVAQKLGSVAFEGWKCPSCRLKLIGHGINLRAYLLDSKQFSLCPRCQELTVTCTEKVLIHATTYSEGKKLITDECQCCSYCRASEQTIPRISSVGGGGGGGDGGGGGGGGGGSGGGGAGG